MKQTKTYNYFPVCVPRLLSCPLRCSLVLSFILYSLLFSAALLTGCSDDTEQEELRGRVTIEAQYCASEFTDVEQPSDSRPMSSTTRAWTTPEYTNSKNETKHFVTYDALNGMFDGQKNLVNKSIGVFLSKDDGSSLKTTFFYKTTSEVSSWKMSLNEIPGGSYYVYGFIPEEDAESATIRPNDGSYSNGAVLDIIGLKTVTASDVCVIVGAKDYPTWLTSYDSDNDSHTVPGLQQGQFDVTFHTGEGAKNYVFLLFDHLYSGLRFGFTIDSEYAKLRTIKLRKLELIAYSTDANAGVKAKYNARITLKKNTDGKTPIVGSVEFTPDDTSADVAPEPLFDWKDDPANYVTLSTTAPSEFMGCFVPGDHTYFKLRSTYDVFDRNQKKDANGKPVYNLIREGCQSENTIDLRDFFGERLTTTRGHCYTFTFTVQPTYLYVLSEPDLDNPTVTMQ
ncbi:MAG: hypothetical protein IKH32_04850 [Prevotella sp.]|nr:hypothetical protein [Prevotella sp.]